jgi:four helix bundle protein
MLVMLSYRASSGMAGSASIEPTIRSYRDLRVWQTAMDLVVEAYRLGKHLPEHERFGLGAQIRRAAVSIPANIAEGHGRLLRGEYLHHLSIARGSLKELETLLVIAERLTYLSADQVANATKLCDSTSRMLTRLRAALRR